MFGKHFIFQVVYFLSTRYMLQKKIRERDGAGSNLEDLELQAEEFGLNWQQLNDFLIMT